MLQAARDHRLHRSRELPSPTIVAIEAAARSPTAIHARLRQLGLWALTPFDDGYPDRLATLELPPPVLYGQGDPATLSAPRAVALVGTRRPTLAGRALAGRVAVRLVECGSTVVSGLAFGIDGAGHAATLEAGGRTVAVIGGGHTFLGPRAHRALARRIAAEGGAVVAEMPPDSRPSKGTFPRRNRIISALSDAVLVIEAPLRSGALITARLALEAGLPVLAAPGRPGRLPRPRVAWRSFERRPHARSSAWTSWSWTSGSPSTRRPRRPRAAAWTARRRWRLLGPAEAADRPCPASAAPSTDLLALRTGLGPAVVAVAVTLLQLRGWVQAFGPSLLPAGAVARGGGTPVTAATGPAVVSANHPLLPSELPGRGTAGR